MGRKAQASGRIFGGADSGLMFPFLAFAQENITVEYDQLRQLLLDGNINLKEANDSYESTKKNYQDLMEQMRQEQEYMKFLAESTRTRRTRCPMPPAPPC